MHRKQDKNGRLWYDRAMAERRRLTRDREFYRRFVKLGSALILEQIAVLCVNLLDNVMIGHYAEASLAGIAAVNQVQFVFQCLIYGVSSSVLALASQYRGKGQNDPVKAILASAMRMALLVAVVFFIIAACFPTQLMRCFTSDEAVIAEGTAYLKIIKYTYLFFAVSNCLLGAMRVVETIMISIYVSFLSLGINFFLDFTLIYGRFGAPRMGVQGAAVGTLAARSIELLIVAVYVFRVDRKLQLCGRDFLRRDRLLARDYLAAGTPIMISQFLWGFSNALQNVILGQMSSRALAAYSASTVLYQLLKVAAQGGASAAVLLVGQAVGQRDRNRVEEYAGTLQVLFLAMGICLGAIYFLVKGPLLSLYTLAPDTYRLASQFMTLQSLVIIGMTYQMPTITGIIRGGGDTRFQLVLDLVSIWGIVLPVSACGAFIFHWPPLLIAFCLNMDQFFKCIPAWIKVNKGTWIRVLTR